MSLSLSLLYFGTPLYDIALELAQDYTDDLEVQEQFIEGVLLAYAVIAFAKEVADSAGT